MLDSVLISAPLSWPWWSLTSSVAFVLWIYGALLFVHQIAEIEGRKIEFIGLAMTIAGCAAATFRSHGGFLFPWVLWLGVTSFGMLVYGSWFCLRALHFPTLERAAIALTVLVNVLFGAHDWWFVRLYGEPSGHTPWMPYSVILFGASLVLVVITRYRKSVLRERDMASNFEKRINENHQDLLRNYEAQKVDLVRQERATERERVLKDMHDGVGAHLSAAIRQLENDIPSKKELLATLHDTLDLLKLTVDGIHIEEGDVIGLLANIRYRLDWRMRAAGLSMAWDINSDAPKLDWMTPQDMQHLRFMVFGIFANILQHARATQMGVSTKIENNRLMLDFTDNGVGFDSYEASGRGLRLLHERAHGLGGELIIESKPGRTLVRVKIPLQK